MGDATRVSSEYIHTYTYVPPSKGLFESTGGCGCVHKFQSGKGPGQMRHFVEDALTPRLGGWHDVFEVQGNATIQQRKNTGKHVLHLRYTVVGRYSWGILEEKILVG